MKYKSYFIFLAIALCIFLFGKLTEENILFPRFNQSYVQRFQKIFSEKEKELNKMLTEQAFFLRKTNSLKTNNFFRSNHIGLLERRGLAIFVYENDSLKLWSDNSVPISNLYSQNQTDSSFVHLKNGWYVSRTIRLGKYTVMGLILIKQSYMYENKFFTSAFQKDFDTPPTVKMSSGKIPGSYPVKDCQNKFLFSLIFDKSTCHPFFQTNIPSVAYLFLMIYLLWVIYHVIREISDKKQRNKVIAFTIFALICIKITMLYFQIPRVFYNLELFRPQYFASSYLIPSLGDLLLWAILIFAIGFIYYRLFTYHWSVQESRWQFISKLSVRLSGVFLFFYSTFFLIRSIILNSTISFEANKLLLFDSYSFFGYIVIMLLFTAFTLFLDKVLQLYVNKTSFLKFFLWFCLTGLFWALVFYIVQNPIHGVSIIFIMILGGSLIYVRYKLKSAYTYTTIVLIVFLYSVYSVFIITKYSVLRNYNHKKVLVTNLANEHDLIAEYILLTIDKDLQKDTFLCNMVTGNDIFPEMIESYLKHNYMVGYFDKYNLAQITICDPQDSVYLEPPDNSWPHCYTFFGNMIKERGTQLPGSNFYFIDNMNGRISYLGWFEYKSPKYPTTVSLFIELASKLVNEALGYPELLLDNRFNQLSRFKGYSYAKYYRGQLVSQYGGFSYNLSAKYYAAHTGEYASMRSGGYDHLVYRPSNGTLIVLSSPALTILDLAVFFSYTFVVYFFIITLIVLLINLPLVKVIFESNFKNKIQYSMLSLLFASLILVGTCTLIFNKRQYFKRHHAIVSEKLQSTYFELLQSLVQERKIDTSWKSYQYNNLNELLIRISNVFYIDINLYDPNGNLIATSRPEIFNKGLMGRKMNAEAYSALVNETKAEVVHDEKIGSLKYISAYMPFKNKDNKLLAFLNVPYFTRQEELTHEVSTMVVAAVNIYVLLLLIASLISVFIARKITMPLRLIQSKFSEIKLGQQYEKMDYPGNDEIGGLVNEYNRMVSELEKSVEMLAKSERESAWREMAKQIAHEINNPLTPMKLSVQHLHRAWVDKNERFGEYLDKISKTLIDEIDNLSAIATEFSNFAKMPKAISQPLDIIVKINNAVSLFSNDDVDFNVTLNGISEVEIFADKEQISRVFINLFKNAVQSVEKGTRPMITIDVRIIDTWLQVRVTDNGKGIPLAMQGKLFRPNFTTKTSGMGLGLAIVKNIIESAGGNITYETKENIGTTFIIDLPVHTRKN
jgi:two-component system, NtrC family, nitrogen regulation sensor histidine kinase NtrY